jgi:hypothetical protein
VVSIRRASDRSRSPGLGWSLIGLALGAAAAFAAATWFGPAPRTGAGGVASRLRGGARRPSSPHTAPLVRAVDRVLARDPQLAPLGLEPIAVSAGRVELHGWVPSRALRARAWRTARLAPGVDQVINCILVRGEDDAAPDSAPA